MANNNSAGEMTFDLGAQQTYRFTSEPLDPKPEYTFKLLGKAEIGKKDEPGKMPYVTVPLEVLNTAKKEGEKNRVLYHRLFTSLKPSKDGKILVNRQDQVVGLGQAIGGKMPEIPLVFLPTGETDQDGQSINQRCLNANALKTWLEGLDGKLIKGKVKTAPAQNGYPAKSEIDFFIPAHVSQSGAGSPDPFADEKPSRKK